MDQPRRFDGVLRWWTVITTVGLFIVILIGFLDTLTGSAEGCGRMWPLCNGGFLPAPTVQSEIEYMHRAITGVVGILVGVLVIWAWRRYQRYWEIIILGAFGLGFVIVQSIVGAMAVLTPESAPVLATHFGFALLAFGGFALMTIMVLELGRGQSGYTLRTHTVPVRLRWGLFGALVYTMGVAYWGTYVAHVGAGTACAGWPLCNGAVIPTPLDGSVLIMFIHRLLAVGILIWAIWLFWRIRGWRRERPDLYRAQHAVLALVALQILSGAAVVLSLDSVTADLIHVGLATLLFTSQAYAFLQGLPSARLRPRRGLEGSA